MRSTLALILMGFLNFGPALTPALGDEVKIPRPSIRFSPEMKMTRDEAKAMQVSIIDNFVNCTLDPDLLEVVKKGNIVISVVPDSREALFDLLKMPADVQEGVKKKLRMESFQVEEDMNDGKPPVHSIYLDESLGKDEWNLLANLHHQLIAVKLVVDKQIPKALGEREQKLYATSIPSLKKIADRWTKLLGEADARVAQMRKQIVAEETKALLWSPLPAKP